MNTLIEIRESLTVLIQITTFIFLLLVILYVIAWLMAVVLPVIINTWSASFGRYRKAVDQEKVTFTLFELSKKQAEDNEE